MKAHKISISPKTITRLGATVLPLVIGGSALVPLTSFAESSAEVSIDLTITSVLTMSLDGIKATENGDGEVGSKIWGLSPGEFSTDQLTEVIARTNAPQGYSITMRGVDAGTGGYADLVGPNDLRMTSSSTVPTSNLDESTWGVRIVAGSEDDANDEADASTNAKVEQNSFWQAVPDNSGKRQDLVIDVSDKPVGGKITNVYYGVAVGRNQHKGVYSGAVRYTMTADSSNIGTTLVYVKYGTTEGITSVSLDGDRCMTPLQEDGTGGCTKALIWDPNKANEHELEATANTAAGYSFVSWTQSGTKGTFASETSSQTTFTLAEEATAIKPVATNKYDVTIKTATGIAKVSLNNVECTSTDGCVVKDLSEAKQLTSAVNEGAYV